ncbi:hypothetical protein Pcinc_043704 [Petrolisthes cinctipes]|uniref:Uncharacterized protein n=1 Tax=Petrolisthes cinctipes TaxID=88211 RepID=A0AAE1BF37_PETCI|nr:hypothetical protein Pcinc_043704 [Petrolisthes cinctipes]
MSDVVVTWRGPIAQQPDTSLLELLVGISMLNPALENNNCVRDDCSGLKSGNGASLEADRQLTSGLSHGRLSGLNPCLKCDYHAVTSPCPSPLCVHHHLGS